jgi:cyclopropane fatty-acyl-phospholipid synthase-like methyltransferase
MLQTPVSDVPWAHEAADALRQSLLNEPPQPLPPLPMMRTIGSPSEQHYLVNMRNYVADLIAEALLHPSSHILDIGSGCGRVATAFTRYLNESGSYLGLDVWDEGVQWCTENISSDRPNFQFRTVSASNNYYYADDSGHANEFGLSFVPTNHFDCIFALSVFTHLKLSDARQYFELIAKSLNKNGSAYLTFFVIDEDVHTYIRDTGNHTGLAPAGDGMWYAYERQDFFSGYELPLLLAQFDEFGLEIVKQSRGSWAQKPGARLYQDWFLLRRAR